MIDIYSVLRHFKRSEFSNPDQMDTRLLLQLDWARHLAGIPYKLTSTYRAGDTRSHGLGKAADISCVTSHTRWIMINALMSAGFNRIGIYPRHLHVDVAEHLPQKVIWYGKYEK